MSKGPGAIELRIADLLAATRDSALSIDQITDHAFELKSSKPTRAQRISATRATHRLLRRVRDAHARAVTLIDQGHDNTKAALGRGRLPYPRHDPNFKDEYDDRLDTDPDFIEGKKLHDYCDHIGRWSRIRRVEGKPGWLRNEYDFWCVTTLKGRTYFHPPNAPVQIWAVSIQEAGVAWVEAEVIRITERNVIVRYADDTARLDRDSLWHWWAFWRGVRFVSSRTGRIAKELDDLWWERYGTAGSVPPSMQMPLAEAMELLGVPADYSRDDVIAGFRRAVKKAHPDVGGTAEMFRKLVEARDRLLAALGTKAPAPKMPTYAPKGSQLVYRSGRSSRTRLPSTTRRLARL
jgi:hypothetical protein